MKSDTENEIVDKLNKKSTLLSIMLAQTKAIIFREREDDADKYIELVEKRQLLMDEILTLDRQIQELENTQSFSDSVKTEKDTIKNSINAVISQILILDKKNKEHSKKILSDIQNNMKSIKEQKNIHNLYGSEKDYSYNGYYFDNKK